MKTARLNYTTGVHDFLKLPNWFKSIWKVATFIKTSPVKVTKKWSNPPALTDTYKSPIKSSFNPIFETSPILAIPEPFSNDSPLIQNKSRPIIEKKH